MMVWSISPWGNVIIIRKLKINVKTHEMTVNSVYLAATINSILNIFCSGHFRFFRFHSGLGIVFQIFGSVLLDTVISLHWYIFTNRLANNNSAPMMLLSNKMAEQADLHYTLLQF